MISEDVADFFAFLESRGFDPEVFERISANREDQRDFPEPAPVRIGKSSIQGVGVFATTDFSEGEIVAPALFEGKRTPAGRYTNHSKSPNAAMGLRENGDIDLTATQPISAGEEVTVNYRQVLELIH
jgi:hypothetical protein